MKNKSLILFFIIVVTTFFCFACNTTKQINTNTDQNQIVPNQANWIFSDLVNADTLKVIYFDPIYYFSINFYPNFLIGVNFHNDTLAVIDKSFHGKVKINSEVIIKPSDWSQTDKDLITMKGYSDIRNWANRIKTIYYCEIQPVDFR